MTRTLFLALCLAAGPAGAQDGCAPRPQVLTRLAENFGESRQSLGLGSNGAVVELFASAETRTWTITVTMPNGITCMLASGVAFEAVTEKQGEQM